MGWVFIVIPLSICCLKYTLYWLLKHVCCVQATCAGWVYIFGRRVKILSSNKTCVKQNTFLFSLGIFQ